MEGVLAGRRLLCLQGGSNEASCVNIGKTANWNPMATTRAKSCCRGEEALLESGGLEQESGGMAVSLLTLQAWPSPS